MEEKKQESPQEELQNILEQMDIPKKRFTDIGWLNRNIGINRQHPMLERALELIKAILKEKYNGENNQS